MNTVSKHSQKAIRLIQKVQALQRACPRKASMIHDIKLARITIRPLMGDLFNVKHVQKDLIYTLWKIVKIEQIAQEARTVLNENELHAFFLFLESISEEQEIARLEKQPEDVHMVMLEVSHVGEFDKVSN